MVLPLILTENIILLNPYNNTVGVNIVILTGCQKSEAQREKSEAQREKNNAFRVTHMVNSRVRI